VFVRVQVLTAASTKMAVFLVAAPCSLAKLYFSDVSEMLAASEDEGSKHL
jgi:hypothetical protein